MSLQYCLHLLEQSRADERLMRTPVYGFLPLEKADVEPVLKELVQISFRVLLPMTFDQYLSNRREGMISCCIRRKKVLDDQGILLVNDD